MTDFSRLNAALLVLLPCTGLFDTVTTCRYSTAGVAGPRYKQKPTHPLLPSLRGAARTRRGVARSTERSVTHGRAAPSRRRTRRAAVLAPRVCDCNSTAAAAEGWRKDATTPATTSARRVRGVAGSTGQRRRRRHADAAGRRRRRRRAPLSRACRLVRSRTRRKAVHVGAVSLCRPGGRRLGARRP